MNLPIRNGRYKLSQGTLFWREVGTGTTLVFLHGSWHDSGQWLPLMHQLGNDYHCLAPDLMGFGESSRVKIPYSVEFEVECLAEWLAALRSHSVYLIGHSLGAWVATRYALQYPEQVRGVILIAPEGIQPSSLPDRWAWHRRLARPVSLTAAMMTLIRPIAKWIGLQAWVMRSQTLRHQLRQFPAACRMLFRRRRAELQAELLHGNLAYLTMPVALLYGEEFDHDSTALTRAYTEGCPASQTITLAGDETLAETQPKVVASEIQFFVGKTLVT